MALAAAVVAAPARRTVARRVNVERMSANAIEAAEQSERLSVPEIREPVLLDSLIGVWPPERKLVFCDEGGGAEPILAALVKAKGPGSELRTCKIASWAGTRSPRVPVGQIH